MLTHLFYRIIRSLCCHCLHCLKLTTPFPSSQCWWLLCLWLLSQSSCSSSTTTTTTTTTTIMLPYMYLEHCLTVCLLIAPLKERSAATEITLHEQIGMGRFGRIWKGEFMGDWITVTIFNSIERVSWHQSWHVHTCLLRYSNIVHFIASDIVDVVWKLNCGLLRCTCRTNFGWGHRDQTLFDSSKRTWSSSFRDD